MDEPRKIGKLASGEAVYIVHNNFAVEKDNQYLVEPSRQEKKEIRKMLKDRKE